MPSTPSLTIAAFGMTSLLAGFATLISPSTTLETLDLPTSALPSVYGNGLAATAMGFYYLLAAYQENHAFFIATVPMRCLTTIVFANLGEAWRTAAIWEGLGAITTFGALVWGKRGREKRD